MDFVPNYDARFHQFERMIDGDTSLTTTGERIRFTGVNTPGKDLCHYAETNKTVFDLLTDREVYFDKDEQASGNAHRLLRYVFLRSNDPTIGDLHVNKYIVEQGLGRSSWIAPNRRCQAQFAAAENRAKAAKRGIWSDLCVGMYADPIRQSDTAPIDPDCTIKGNIGEKKPKRATI